MSADAFIFWFLTIITVASAIMVITMANPIFSALSLAMTMVGVAALFVTLDAYFLAGVQLIVYAGAVMVLFVMVLMLFDLKHELKAYSRGLLTGGVKLATAGLFAGLVVGAVLMTADSIQKAPEAAAKSQDVTASLGQTLFSHYLFGFEALGVLLLIVAVGSVALARSKGGTHV